MKRIGVSLLFAAHFFVHLPTLVGMDVQAEVEAILAEDEELRSITIERPPERKRLYYIIGGATAVGALLLAFLLKHINDKHDRLHGTVITLDNEMNGVKSCVAVNGESLIALAQERVRDNENFKQLTETIQDEVADHLVKHAEAITTVASEVDKNRNVVVRQQKQLTEQEATVEVHHVLLSHQRERIVDGASDRKDIKKKVRVVKKRVDSVEIKVDANEERLDKHDHELHVVKVAVRNNEEAIREQDERVDHLKQRVTHVEDDSNSLMSTTERLVGIARDGLQAVEAGTRAILNGTRTVMLATGSPAGFAVESGLQSVESYAQVSRRTRETFDAFDNAARQLTDYERREDRYGPEPVRGEMMTLDELLGISDDEESIEREALPN